MGDPTIDHRADLYALGMTAWEMLAGRHPFDGMRGAHFACAAALVTPDGREVVEEGRLEGTLTRVPRGTGGFGYDPVLQPTGETRTTAEMTSEEKDAISHRGRAFRALVPHVARELDG